MAALGREVKTPEMVWNKSMRAEAAARVADLARRARAMQVC